MKVVVNYDLCESNALCVLAAPQVFDVLSDDSLALLIEYPGEDLRPDVEAAVRACPKQAITIED